MKKVCVIGAGPSGLAAIKHCKDFGIDVTAFDKNSEVGGLWIYTDQVGKDKYGAEIHSSMYQGLLTNLPKQLMEYPGFERMQDGHSFVGSKEILEYYNLYADEFGLKNFIKFEHEVIRVRPLIDETWEVLVRNLPENSYKIEIFDGVMVCNGFSDPWLPKFSGDEIFKGKQMHSHDFRTGENFVGEKVLIIGAGPSGIEMTLEIGKRADKVFWSNHARKTYGKDFNIALPESVEKKSDVERFAENGAFFDDGSFEEISVVLYATGYDFTFPFLTVDCELSAEEKHIRPLFKHCININRPSLAIIGLPFFALGVPMFDLQVRFFLKFFSGGKALPSKEEMMLDMLEDEEQRKLKNFPKKKSHYLGMDTHADYYKNLARLAEIEPIKPVLAKMFNKTVALLFENFNTYRHYNFRIDDDENFSTEFVEHHPEF